MRFSRRHFFSRHFSVVLRKVLTNFYIGRFSATLTQLSTQHSNRWLVERTAFHQIFHRKRSLSHHKSFTSARPISVLIPKCGESAFKEDYHWLLFSPLFLHFIHVVGEVLRYFGSLSFISSVCGDPDGLILDNGNSLLMDLFVSNYCWPQEQTEDILSFLLPKPSYDSAVKTNHLFASFPPLEDVNLWPLPAGLCYFSKRGTMLATSATPQRDESVWSLQNFQS